MRMIYVVIVICILGGAYKYWGYKQTQTAIAQATSENGFISLQPVVGQDANTVYVAAAENCPSEAAQRADNLARDISRNGIPVKRTHVVQFEPVIFQGMPDKDALTHIDARINKVMKGPLPIVFINGRAKANPSLNDVISEYKRNSV